eukprot:EG_transcript_3648
MDSFKFNKLCRDTKLFDKNFTTIGADVVFAKAKGIGERKINFATFKDIALPLIAAEKGCTVKELVAKVKEAEGPLCTGTRAEMVKLHDDKSTFTGVCGWKVLQKAVAGVRDEQLASPKDRKERSGKKKKVKKKKKQNEALPQAQDDPGSSSSDDEDEEDDSSESSPVSPQSEQEGLAQAQQTSLAATAQAYENGSISAGHPGLKVVVPGGGTTVQVKMKTVQQVALAAMEQAKKASAFPSPLSSPIASKANLPVPPGSVNKPAVVTVPSALPRNLLSPASSGPGTPSSVSQSPTNSVNSTSLSPSTAVPLINLQGPEGTLLPAQQGPPASGRKANAFQLNLAKVEAGRPKSSLFITPRSSVPLSPHIPSPPMAPKAGGFHASQFKMAYDVAVAPDTTEELVGVLHDLLTRYAALRGIEMQRAELFFEDLKVSAVKELHSQVQLAAARLWTSPRTLDKKELCFILNELLREDHGPLMPFVAGITRAINLLLVGLDRMSMTPSSNVVFRGGGLPDEHRPFFTTGRKYRVPMFTATSIDRDLCQRIFCRRAETHHKQPPVLWVIALDERDGCKHVNYIHTTECKEEQEYLFSPYSVFTVQTTDWKAAPHWKDPHIVYLRAAVDNRLEPEDLPLSPWA